MRTPVLAILLGGFGCWTASADVITLSDQINNNLFASSSYTLIANNAKALTTTTFADGTTTASAAETPSTPDMRLPAAPNGVSLPLGEVLTSAVYDLSYEFSLDVNRNRINGEGTNRAQFDPTFGVTNNNFSVTLVLRDINDGVLATLDVTSLSSVDLLPYLLDGGPIENAFETGGVFLRTKFRADSVSFSADISGYNAANNPDRNVELDYALKERLAANSSLTLGFAPEPSSYVLMGLGLVAVMRFRRKR